MDELSFWLSTPLLWLGAFFFLAGSLGLLRFPDLPSRLHAITKADTLGFVFVVFGLALRASAWRDVLVMALIALLIMVSSSITAQLLARYHATQDTTEHD